MEKVKVSVGPDFCGRRWSAMAHGLVCYADHRNDHPADRKLYCRAEVLGRYCLYMAGKMAASLTGAGIGVGVA